MIYLSSIQFMANLKRDKLEEERIKRLKGGILLLYYRV